MLREVDVHTHTHFYLSLSQIFTHLNGFNPQTSLHMSIKTCLSAGLVDGEKQTGESEAFSASESTMCVDLSHSRSCVTNTVTSIIINMSSAEVLF